MNIICIVRIPLSVFSAAAQVPGQLPALENSNGANEVPVGVVADEISKEVDLTATKGDEHMTGDPGAITVAPTPPAPLATSGSSATSVEGGDGAAPPPSSASANEDQDIIVDTGASRVSQRFMHDMG